MVLKLRQHSGKYILQLILTVEHARCRNQKALLLGTITTLRLVDLKNGTHRNMVKFTPVHTKAHAI